MVGVPSSLVITRGYEKSLQGCRVKKQPCICLTKYGSCFFPELAVFNGKTGEECWLTLPTLSCRSTCTGITQLA